MYIILHASTIHDLQYQVTIHIANGWLPAGGVTTQAYYHEHDIVSNTYNYIIPDSSNSHTIHYLQAVYKPQSKELL